MALLLKCIAKSYIFARDDLRDPRTADWFLVDSPIQILFIVAMYLFVVKTWLPKFMENRPPYNFKQVLVCYNLLQIVLNGYLIIKATPSLKTLNLRCAPVDYSNDPHAMNFVNLVWLYYMTKMIDLLDTIFFILRKKSNQVSFLHVYHHALITLCAWMGAKYFAGGESIIFGYVNSAVHVIMYSYYLCAAWMPDKKNALGKWKKYITQIQILQFVTLLALFAPKIFIDCRFPKFPIIMMIPQCLLMIIMFGDFYYRSYVKVAKAKGVDFQATWHKQ